MTLNELRDEAYSYAQKQGFHEQKTNFGETLMLIVSELSEALEADRNNCWSRSSIEKGLPNPEKIDIDLYKMHFRGTVEEEIADAIIRLCDLAGTYKIDLDWHVKAKMAYNKTRPYKHDKKY